MQTGTKISGFLHLGALGLAVFGGVLFKAPTSDAIQISEVSIISSEDFAAMQSTTPDPLPEVATAPRISPTEITQDAAPSIAQPAEPDTPTSAPEDQVAIVAPVPTPDVNATKTETPQAEVTPDETATKVEEPKQAEAPKQSATEIVLEPEKPSEFAPNSSDIPRLRPRDMAARVAKANTPEPEPAVKPVAEDNTADEIAKALAAAEAENNKPDVPLGPPMTGSERAGLVLAVQECWNVPIGVQDAENLVVVLSVKLNMDGSLDGKPELIDPSGQITPLQNKAFEAGRRALIRCGPYDLPSEKYEQWRQIEVVFNPEKMAVR